MSGSCGLLAGQVAEDGYVTDSLDAGQRHAAAGAIREDSGVDEPRRPGVTDEEWRNSELPGGSRR